MINLPSWEADTIVCESPAQCMAYTLPKWPFNVRRILIGFRISRRGPVDAATAPIEVSFFCLRTFSICSLRLATWIKEGRGMEVECRNLLDLINFHTRELAEKISPNAMDNNPNDADPAANYHLN